MTQQTIAQLSALLLCIIASARIFFIKKVKKDFLCTLPSIALFIAIAQIIAFGMSSTQHAVLVICFFVFFWNFRALLRFIGNLVVDHYGIAFQTVSIISLILSVFSFIYIFINRPVKINEEKKFEVSKTDTIYSGNFSYGFIKKTTPFTANNVRLSTYSHIIPQIQSPSVSDYIKSYQKENNAYKLFKEAEEKHKAQENNEVKEEQTSSIIKKLDLSILKEKDELEKEKKPDLYKQAVTSADEEAVAFQREAQANIVNTGTILFIPDKCSKISDYNPMLLKLARDGYLVMAADFYTKELRYFNNAMDSYVFRSYKFRKDKLKNSNDYKKYTSDIDAKITREYEALIQIAGVQTEDKVYLLGDETAKNALVMTMDKNPALVDGIINMADFNDYQAGFGCIEQTDPLLAKKFGKKRDKTLYQSAHLATLIEKMIESPDVEIIAEPEKFTLE